ncbi:MAG: selenoneine synthase SenA [Spiribacter sp.]|jgi:iron(II)-dependent oxidoreductase|nr:selenoneine synthase SenA [Spiribacter sp.]
MITTPSTHPLTSETLISMLDDARQRTHELTHDLPAERRLGPKLSIVNPPQWEIGHVGFFHDHFVLHQLHGLPDYQIPHAEALYDSMGVAHDERWALGLPSMDDTLAYLRHVRDTMVSQLPEGLTDSATSYVWQLATFHEDMHGEAFAYTRQTLADPMPTIATPANGLAPLTTGRLNGEVLVPGGEHTLGADETVPFRFDNEKNAHSQIVAPFTIDIAPVTNAAFAQFVEAGGYENPEYWSDAGWKWREDEALSAPAYWRFGSTGWEVRVFDRWSPLPAHAPVSHVSQHEALAYCQWAGRRLPTELEWEVAASREAAGQTLTPEKNLYPWGNQPGGLFLANTDGYRVGSVDVAAYSAGDSALGCRQMLGNVWEWTASPFTPYPGFKADLYAEYSEPWFKDGRFVLRGGSWATRRRHLNNNTRNFFPPDRNDIIAGFRTCAR